MQYSLLYNMLQGISAPSLFTKGSLARGEKNTEPYCQSDISLQTVLIPVTLEIEGIKNIYKKKWKWNDVLFAYCPILHLGAPMDNNGWYANEVSKYLNILHYSLKTPITKHFLSVI